MRTTLKFFGYAYLLIGKASSADDFGEATPCKTMQQDFSIFPFAYAQRRCSVFMSRANINIAVPTAAGFG
jgi:hypothetical protein